MTENAAPPPLVSVITPAFNAAKFIRESIESVIAQTYPNWELIVVDDGSSDDTADIVSDYAAKDPRIHLILQANAGVGKARNAGLAGARGEYVAFLDADDLWRPCKLESQLAVMHEFKVDLTYSLGWIFTGVFDNSSAYTPYPRRLSGLHSGPELLNALFTENPIAILSVLARRDVVMSVNGFTEMAEYQRAEDYELWLRLAADGATFYGSDDPLFYYRRHDNAATWQMYKLHGPAIAVLHVHETNPALDPAVKQRRFQSLYRAQVAALVDARKLAEARIYLQQLKAYQSAPVQVIQKAVFAMAGARYNRVMTPFYSLGHTLKSLIKPGNGGGESG